MKLRNYKKFIEKCPSLDLIPKMLWDFLFVPTAKHKRKFMFMAIRN